MGAATLRQDVGGSVVIPKIPPRYGAVHGGGGGAGDQDNNSGGNGGRAAAWSCPIGSVTVPMGSGGPICQRRRRSRYGNSHGDAAAAAVAVDRSSCSPGSRLTRASSCPQTVDMVGRRNDRRVMHLKPTVRAAVAAAASSSIWPVANQRYRPRDRRAEPALHRRSAKVSIEWRKPMATTAFRSAPRQPTSMGMFSGSICLPADIQVSVVPPSGMVQQGMNVDYTVTVKTRVKNRRWVRTS